MSASGPLALALLRGTHVAALLVLVGTFGVSAFVGGHTAPPGLRRIAIRATVLALTLGAAWLVAAAAAIDGATSLWQAIGAVPAMLAYFAFGRLLLLRLALLAVVLAGLLVRWDGLALGRPRAVLGGLSVVALGVQPWLGHAGAAVGPARMVLPAAELVHLAGAALWLGGLPAFGWMVRDLDGTDLVRCVHRFSTLAQAAVLAIAAGGAAEGWLLIGGVARLTGTGYGMAVLVKTALFGAAMAFASVNRLVLTPRLHGPQVARSRRQLCRTVQAETLLGLGIILTAGWLAGLPPGADQSAAVHAGFWLPFALVAPATAGLALLFRYPVASLSQS